MNEADNGKNSFGHEGSSSSSGMHRLVGIKFKVAGKTHYFDTGTLLFNIGEKVVVESDKGLGMGRVVTLVREVPAEQVPPDTRKIIRRANWNDLERQRKNREREREAFVHCKDRIHERNLDMKLIRVEYLHDASKAIFYYTAQQRVDFRDLVKDLAHRLHTRIEMKQIGVRDEAKLIGALGNCGRYLCCSTFLSDFTPVSVRMAKDQNLAMNPAKVSGVCGRLMCCLAYEYETYEEMLRNLPKKGRWVLCPKGRGRIIDINIFTKKAQVILEDGTELAVDVSGLKTATANARNQTAADKEKEKDSK